MWITYPQIINKYTLIVKEKKQQIDLINLITLIGLINNQLFPIGI